MVEHDGVENAQITEINAFAEGAASLTAISVLNKKSQLNIRVTLKQKHHIFEILNLKLLQLSFPELLE